MNKTKNLVFAALCTALGLVLPVVFHALPGGGDVLLPMHLPVLLCGFLCSWPYALLCGLMTPLLSFLLTNMPNAASLPGMMVELALYGAVPALMLRFVTMPNRMAQVYASLVTAMLAGRLASGFVKAFLFRAGQYSMEVWLTASFVTAIPGILAQLILIPALVLALQNAGSKRH